MYVAFIHGGKEFDERKSHNFSEVVFSKQQGSVVSPEGRLDRLNRKSNQL